MAVLFSFLFSKADIMRLLWVIAMGPL